MRVGKLPCYWLAYDLSLIEPKIREAMASFVWENLEKINLAIKELFTKLQGQRHKNRHTNLYLN